MKHLSKLAAILAALVLACAFFGCSDGSDGNSINGNQSISLSDGDYTLKIKQSANGMVEEDDIKATASNNILTFNSGSVTVTQELTAEKLKYFEAMSEEEKKAMAKEMGFSDAKISFDGNKLIIKANLSAEELAKIQPYYQLSSIPADAKIETIKDKTEYKVTLFMEGVPVEFHIKKD
ncbi:MAG: hypothetical protein MSC48_09065 [Spirochaetia bacterium]|nr:hypothetical protein [Spirochaetia bacterium]